MQTPALLNSTSSPATVADSLDANADAEDGEDQEDDSDEDEGDLYMVHYKDLKPNVNSAGEVPTGESRFLCDAHSKFIFSQDDIWWRGGQVLRVAFGPDDNGPKLQEDVMVCHRNQCLRCTAPGQFVYTAMMSTTENGMPFVHSGTSRPNERGTAVYHPDPTTQYEEERDKKSEVEKRQVVYPKSTRCQLVTSAVCIAATCSRCNSKSGSADLGQSTHLIEPSKRKKDDQADESVMSAEGKQSEGNPSKRPKIV